MSIEFDKEEGRRNYLIEKMDDLLDGINASYGKTLLDELITRLEKTIGDFNEEVQALMDQLKANAEKKEKLLKDIIAAEQQEKPEASTAAAEPEPTREMSEWERKLESMSK
jgi:cell division septum initiation protein DivIVA